MKKIYNPKVYQFLENFDMNLCSEWTDEHSWEIWGEYFRAVRYWLKRRNQTEFTYVVLLFNDKQVSIQFNVNELGDCFNKAMTYFVSVEDFEMCKYIRDFAKNLNITICI